jgi:hypothetical protein
MGLSEKRLPMDAASTWDSNNNTRKHVEHVSHCFTMSVDDYLTQLPVAIVSLHS